MPASRIVTCRDIEGNTYEVPVDQLTFRPSVYGVIVQDGKVLLSKQWDGYDFPGGGVELGESIEAALQREVKEETGLAVKPGDIVFVANDFFKLPSTQKFIHSILMFYQCEVVGGKISTEFFDDYEKQYAEAAEWIELSNIDTLKFVNPVNSPGIIRKSL